MSIYYCAMNAFEIPEIYLYKIFFSSTFIHVRRSQA